MSTVDQASKASRKALFSPALFIEITKMVEGGLTPPEIATKIGCTLGSLRVKCSQWGISLRRNRAEANQVNLQRRLTIKLSENLALRLQLQAQKSEVSPAKLATLLIEAIVEDELYTAVIDETRPRTVRGRRGGL
jgi:hypothetical protein